MPTNSSTNYIYSTLYRRLHWSLALIFILLLILGQQFNFDISDSYRIHGLKAHSTFGTIALFIALGLIIKRFVLRHPIPSHKLSLIKIIMARTVQICLYMLAIFIPISGAVCAMHSAYPVYLFGILDISHHLQSTEASFTYFRIIHVWSTKTLMFLLLCHAGAAFYHHFIVKDKILKSMAIIDPLVIFIWQRIMNRDKKKGDTHK